MPKFDPNQCLAHLWPDYQGSGDNIMDRRVELRRAIPSIEGRPRYSFAIVERGEIYPMVSCTPVLIKRFIYQVDDILRAEIYGK